MGVLSKSFLAKEFMGDIMGFMLIELIFDG